MNRLMLWILYVFFYYFLPRLSSQETIDSLAEAIKEFKGGVVLVSHDFRLISQIAEQIWVCENGTVTPWNGTIAEYKAHLKKEVMKA